MLLEVESAEAVPTGRQLARHRDFPDAPRARLVEVAQRVRSAAVRHPCRGRQRAAVRRRAGREDPHRARRQDPAAAVSRPLARPRLELRRARTPRTRLRARLSRPRGDFFVAHTAKTGEGRCAHRALSAVLATDPDRADPARRASCWTMDDPAGNHNGGMIAFGPDGCLWVGTGDGGSGGDPWDNAQQSGVASRQDAAHRRRSLTRRLPARAPVEIWALGLRNPWRFSFDRATGEIWIGDVGQNAWEEIDVADSQRPAPLHFGWKTMEGLHCYDPRQGCDAKGLELPIHEYGHDSGCSVTGGYVYRGKAIPALAGKYLFSRLLQRQGLVAAARRRRQGAGRHAAPEQGPGELVRRGRGWRALSLRPRRRRRLAVRPGSERTPTAAATSATPVPSPVSGERVGPGLDKIHDRCQNSRSADSATIRPRVRRLRGPKASEAEGTSTRRERQSTRDSSRRRRGPRGKPRGSVPFRAHVAQR